MAKGLIRLMSTIGRMLKIEIEAAVGDRNELMIPRAIAERHGITPGQRMMVIDTGADGEFTVRVLPRGYAGALADVFHGTTDENVDYVRGERATWD